MPSWNWGESQSESGVVHQSTANTDHDDAATLKQGYDIANPYLSNDLLLYWPFHEDSGSTAYDFAGTNDGTINGATVGQTGLLGTSAYSLDGVDDSVTGSVLSGVSKNDSWSISMWFTWDDTTQKGNLISHIDGGSDRIAIGNGGNNGELNTAIYNGISFEYTGYHTNLSSGTWYHAVFTWNGSGSGELYLNATPTTKTGNQASQIATTNFAVGERDSDIYWLGDIADVRIYNRVLSASEVQTLYDVVNTSGTWTGTAKSL